jgi:hypothetical protein
LRAAAERDGAAAVVIASLAMRSTIVAIAIVPILVAAAAGCGKKSDAPAASGSTASGSTASGSTASGSTASGSAVPAPPPDAAAPAAPPAPPDAAEAAAVDPQAIGEKMCPDVLAKIIECRKNPEFIAALEAGASAKDLKITKQLLKEVADWPDNFSCGSLAASYQYGGFLYHWEKMAAAPDPLSSCAKLGAAIQSAGGLFGGEAAN